MRIINYFVKGSFILMGIVMILFIVAMIAFGVAGIHDVIFGETSYRSEMKLLDDVQYLDGGRILYRFGDLVIKDYSDWKTINIGEYYEVVYMKCINCWLGENNVWIYYELKI